MGEAGKNAVKWTRLSCHDFVDNQVRLSRCISGFALAYNLGNFLRRLALPRSVKHWSLTTLREKLIKTCLPPAGRQVGAKVVTHARYVIFQTRLPHRQVGRWPRSPCPEGSFGPSLSASIGSGHGDRCRHDGSTRRTGGKTWGRRNRFVRAWSKRPEKGRFGHSPWSMASNCPLAEPGRSLWMFENAIESSKRRTVVVGAASSG